MKGHRRASRRKDRDRCGLSEYPLNAEGVWCEVLRRLPPGRPALFLDRDGAVVEDTEYLCRVEDIVMIPGAAAVIAAANRRGVAVVLVTNQAGIGRGYYGWAEFKRCATGDYRGLGRRRRAARRRLRLRASSRKAATALLIRTIRRASQIPACCCKRRPILRSISRHRGLSATRPAMSRPPSAPASPAPCRWRPATALPSARHVAGLATSTFRGPVRPLDRRCDDAADFVGPCKGDEFDRARMATIPPRLLYVVSEDWAFLSHRLPMARAARDAGFEVHVATRVKDVPAAIEAKDFILHPIPFARGRLSPLAALATIARAAPDLHRDVDAARSSTTSHCKPSRARE